MKKFIAFAAVCGFALAFVACGKKETAETHADTTVVETPAPVVADTTAADTTATDTTAAPAH
ncbi:hypothetical protein [Parachryseolinea silvisoli]|jgi:hypothetical protein|uniref:hypothetical protein n=1 Tax=Parachryseolinea silvisoli TaxID=2873601 RepID=UPI002265DA5E|nr:hypothetical protein [Parachryseolinea silvisoli]MCD9016048.1 hypothetical protein [Parachryseolinea silvisoli]